MNDIFDDREPSYVCTGKHRGQKPTYAQWAISKAEEVDLFYRSFDSTWAGDDGTHWGVLEGASELGTRGEIISKYPKPSNDFDAWHGYPASPQRKVGDSPPEAIVTAWFEELRLIGKSDYLAILRRRA